MEPEARATLHQPRPLKATTALPVIMSLLEYLVAAAAAQVLRLQQRLLLAPAGRAVQVRHQVSVARQLLTLAVVVVVVILVCPTTKAERVVLAVAATVVLMLHQQMVTVLPEQQILAAVAVAQAMEMLPAAHALAQQAAPALSSSSTRWALLRS